MLYRKIVCSILFIGLAYIASSQGGFNAKIFAGPTFSQIQGDQLAGFDKVGYEAGVGVSYALYPKIDIAVEFGYLLILKERTSNIFIFQ